MTLSGIALLVVGVVIAVRAKPEKPLTDLSQKVDILAVS